MDGRADQGGSEVSRGRRSPLPTEVPPEKRRRWLIWTLASVVGALTLMIGGPWAYSTWMKHRAPDPLTLTAEVAEPEETTGPFTVDGSWQVAEGSEAGYRLDEVLFGQATTPVGRTEQVSGTVVVQDGMLTEAQVVVDVATISTDESARDAYFRRALDTTEYPEATFELTEPVDVTSVSTASAAVPVSAAGRLTLRGETVPVSATLEVRRAESGVEIAGSIPIVLDDFGLKAPDLEIVKVQPEGLVEWRIDLTQ